MSANGPRLHVVGGELPEPPYPVLKAHGWRFELDYERIEASSTWDRASDELRPWLLMLWYRSWQRIPMGTLPNDDVAIAGLLRMPLTMFQTYRETLLRGWYVCRDGRMYHPVITEQVLKLAGKRRLDTERVAAWRAKQNQEVAKDETPESQVGNALPTTPVLEPEKFKSMPSDSAPDRFVDFWEAWPKSKRKVDRKDCAYRWKRKGLDALADRIIANVNAMKRSEQWRDGFEPAPATYLNGERWNDPLPPELAASVGRSFKL